MIPSLLYIPNHEILPTADGIFLKKILMNQEKKLSVSINPLPIQNHNSRRLRWYVPRPILGISPDGQEEGAQKV